MISKLTYTKLTDTLYEISFKKTVFGTLIMAEDGYFMWISPDNSTNSWYSSWILDDISNKIKELNKPIENHLNKYNNMSDSSDKEGKEEENERGEERYKIFPQQYEGTDRYLRHGDVCRILDADESDYGEAIYEIYVWIDHINAYMWIDVEDLVQISLTKNDPKIIEEEFGDMFGEYMSYTISTHMENRKYLGHITGELIKEKLDPVVYIHVLTLFKHQ